MITRRLTLLSTAALAACSSSGGPPDAQVLADLQGLIPVVQATLAAIQLNDPKAIPSVAMAQITALGTAAQTALANFAAATTTSGQAASLQVIEQYLNAALAAIGAALPAASVAFPPLAQYMPIYQAAVALLQLVIEPYLNSLVPTTPAPVYAPAPAMTAAQARAILNTK